MKSALLILLLTLAGGVAAAPPPNPERITLSLKDATPYEAAAAITRASGVRVEIFPEAGLEARDSFLWNDILLGEALRQMANRYRLTLEARIGGAFRLNGGVIHATGRPPRDVGVCERGGVRLSVAGVSVGSTRSSRFAPVARSSGDTSIAVDVAVRGTTLDPQRLAGLANVVAKDDQGGLLVPTDSSASIYQFEPRAPEVWKQFIQFAPGHPAARKLLWVEGDALAYERFERFQLELPVPREGEQPRKQLGDVAVQLTRLVPGLPSGPNDGPNQRLLGGPRLMGEIRAPGGVHLAAPNGYWPVPVLVGASGRFYPPTRSGGGTETSGAGVVQTLDVGYAVIDEPIAGVRLDLVIKAAPKRLFSFRLRDIPLPQATPFAPKNNPRPVPRGERPAPQSQPAGGGELVSPVRVAGQAAPDGTLQLGLSLRSGMEWGATRWSDARVTGGIARVSHLAPGSYRVFRAYRPEQELSVPEEGRWVNDELEVVVSEARPVTLKPLEWRVGAERPAAGGSSRVKPAVPRR